MRTIELRSPDMPWKTEPYQQCRTSPAGPTDWQALCQAHPAIFAKRSHAVDTINHRVNGFLRRLVNITVVHRVIYHFSDVLIYSMQFTV